MKASDITEGTSYLIAVTIPAGPATGRMRTTQQATVVAKDRNTVTVEVLEPVCVNLHEIPDDQIIDAQFGTKRTRWEKRPVRRQARAADILHPLPTPATV